MEKNVPLIKTLAEGIINQNVPATILVEYDGVKTYSAYHIESNYNYKIFLNSSTKSVISAIAPLILQMLKIRGSDIFKLKHDNTLEGLQYALSYEGIDLEYSEGIDLEYIEMAGNAVTIRLSKGIW